MKSIREVIESVSQNIYSAIGVIIGILGILVAVAALIASIAVPEIRETVGLDPQNPPSRNGNPSEPSTKATGNNGSEETKPPAPIKVTEGENPQVKGPTAAKETPRTGTLEKPNTSIAVKTTKTESKKEDKAQTQNNVPTVGSSEEPKPSVLIKTPESKTSEETKKPSETRSSEEPKPSVPIKTPESKTSEETKKPSETRASEEPKPSAKKAQEPIWQTSINQGSSKSKILDLASGASIGIEVKEVSDNKGVKIKLSVCGRSPEEKKYEALQPINYEFNCGNKKYKLIGETSTNKGTDILEVKVYEIP